MKKLFVIIATMACIAVLVWRFTCPALVRIRTSIFAGSTLVLVLNPIRSQSARNSAESLLEFLHTKDALGALKRFPLLDRHELEDSILNPPTHWTLDDVVAEPGGGLAFEYINATASHEDMGGYIWIHCIRNSQGIWTVSSFDRVF